MTTPQIVLLKEGTTQTKGNDAQKNNISAAKLIAELVRTSLGPRGMDKMLVDTLGDVTITNDGATILKEIDVQHPAAKMMVEISKATDNEVGDGTTSTVVLAGALLEKAEELIGKNVHPTVVVDGFKKAAEKAIAELRQIGIKIDALDKKFLKKVAVTTLSSKLVSSNSDELADIVVDAVLSVAEKVGDKYKVDIDNIKVEKKGSSSIKNTELIHGIILDKEVVHGGMPKRIDNAKIALLNAPLEIEKTEFDAKININSPEQMQVYIDEENKMLKKLVDKIVASGANTVLCQKGIDDMAQYYLAKSNILAVRRIKESDLTKLSKATGARIVTNINELTEKDLGTAKTVEERQVESDKWVFIEGCKNPKAVSILARGGSQRVVDEVERSIHDALMAVKDVVEYPYVLVGGGAPEARISAKLREWANSLEGRPQLAAQKFAEGLETIPLVLAENAGMDPLDTQVQLRAKGTAGAATFGIDVANGKVADLGSQQIYEPLAVKEQVVNAATEAACMILRIDDVIAASKPSTHAPSPGGPPGMGGMGGMDM
ncbi:MAG: thermosome subunit beta [Candidatus Nitrosotenuis sp.]|uniref:Thermosome subunit alpha n=1 Tax=Candidatus Nitrosotenuis uzonensis TaxID=1407055 RepID=V6AUS8_9ARCH|nr:thermosome subunit beta [Candidatus Nitrosotenuis uzonensis]CDI06213.1 Thermosome subunit alpha [Candidatus Nitrosotenuis uzonensis]